jgi:hypothetical protein
MTAAAVTAKATPRAAMAAIVTTMAVMAAATPAVVGW